MTPDQRPCFYGDHSLETQMRSTIPLVPESVITLGEELRFYFALYDTEKAIRTAVQEGRLDSTDPGDYKLKLFPLWSIEQGNNIMEFMEKRREDLKSAFMKQNPEIDHVDAEEFMENKIIRMSPLARDWIIRRLPSMSGKVKEALLMHVFFDLSFSEVATVMGSLGESVIGTIVGRMKNEIFARLRPDIPNFRNAHYIEASHSMDFGYLDKLWDGIKANEKK